MAVLAACAMIFSGCTEQDKDETNIDFELLYGRMWVPDYYSQHNNAVPEVATDCDYPIYFDRDARQVVILHCTGEEYDVYRSYGVQIDESKGLLRFTGGEDGNLVIHVSRLTVTHMTVYFGSDEDNFVCYKSSELPEDKE